MDRYPPSGLSILIVGGGIGGLTFAIEGYRKGHEVRVLEKRPNFEGYVKNWPGFFERLEAISYKTQRNVKKFDGTWIGSWPIGDGENRSAALNRSELHGLLWDYVQELGIKVDFDKWVDEYFETDTHGGVVLADGQRVTADIVVAADGVGSKSWPLILGQKDKPTSSGFVCYRATFPAGPALQNPIIAKEFVGHVDRVSLHIGPGAHMVVGKTERQICYILTHRDDHNAEESWDKTVSTDTALQYIDGWEPFLTEILKATPGHRCTDWKLLWRNPQPKWASRNARVIQLGDAAHSFLPTSGSGAAMAMEDAYSLATCLQLGGKSNAPFAKMGFHHREKFHNTDWDEVARNPDIFSKTTANWIMRHNPEQYAYNNYARCARHILEGEAFQNNNIPPGYRYEPWTVKELMEASDSHEPVIDEGDWS
ncbi:monooxygenase [Aspergillus udagawae]|nr:monooxygenase [Aspergillus udagawae]